MLPLAALGPVRARFRLGLGFRRVGASRFGESGGISSRSFSAARLSTLQSAGITPRQRSSCFVCR